MKKKINWEEIPGRSILSDRDALRGEKICVFVINTATDEILEKNFFTPSDSEAGHYIWPLKISEEINKNSDYIRAGEMNKKGEIVPLASQYRNKLWRKENSNLVVYPTNCCLDCWKAGGTLLSTGKIIPGIKIVISTRSRNHGLLYESLSFIADNKAESMYSWPYYLSDFINKNSLFLRAGEKNKGTKLISPLHSSYRNVIWMPDGSNYIYEMEYEANDEIKNDAEKTYINSLAVLTVSLPPSRETIDKWLHGFSQGKFSDILYPQADAGSNTAPLYEHLQRTRAIANYVHHSNLSEAEIYYISAVEALHFYTRQDFKTSNWWDRQIGLSKIAAEISILLTEKFTSSLLSDCISYLKKTTNTAMGQTGANQADFAWIQLLWALSGWKNTRLASFLNEAYAASDSISSLCLPVTRHGNEGGEGISVDNSFSQHNPHSGRYSQLYAGSYGTVLLDNIFKTQSVLYGVFSLSMDAVRSLENFLINGMGWFSYARLYDFHVCGRAISRGMNGSAALAGWCRQLINSSPQHPERLLELIRRADGDENNNKFYQGCSAYWVNDYIARISDKYSLWAKVISNRTVGGESGNGENLKGYYMGCGSYFITRNGNEYRNIQPVWEWQRIPGTTVEQVKNFSYPLVDWGYNNWGSHDFAGAISDRNTGIASMILTRRNVKNARKSVITLADKSVFMGSSIDITASKNAVYTSVNQCILNGNVRIIYNNGSEQVASLGQRITSNKIIKVIHDGLCYDFPCSQTVTVQVAIQTGSWRSINKNSSDEVLSRAVFSVWIEHEKGNSLWYYYEVSSADTSMSVLKTRAIHDDQVHIITDVDKTHIAAVIFTNEGYEVALSNVKIKTLSPVSFIASVREDGILKFTVADMTQKKTTADFIFSWGEVTSLTSFTLPTGDQVGSSVSYLIAPVISDES